ncbi:MAG: ABC transporter, partial [Actinobacteria bacterium]|nr:ABC transporter [Actinomycetota bacterium]
RVQVSGGGRRLAAGVDAAPGLATALVRALDAAGALVDNIEVRRPSLDDVFFALTGGHIPAGGHADGAGDAGASRRTSSDKEVREAGT